jgi:hypothetical protein
MDDQSALPDTVRLGVLGDLGPNDRHPNPPDFMLPDALL